MINSVHSLTSPSKVTIIEEMRSAISPSELAESMNMTRQAVEKHLKELLKYGIVERIWVTGSTKPHLEYRVTELGRNFYDRVKNLMHEYRESGIVLYREKLKSLDLKLAESEIDMQKYMQLRSALEGEMSWFLQ